MYDEQKSKQWLKAGSASHKALQGIVTDKKLIKDISMVTKFCHTGNLESFQNIMLKYVPKRIAISYEGMVTRTMLAALDNNNNVGRKQSTDSMSEKQWKVQWSKRTKTFVAKQVVGMKDYLFREELTNATLDRLQNKVGADVGAIQVSVSELARGNISRQSKPTKADVVKERVQI